jgi:hypothetical protein
MTVPDPQKIKFLKVLAGLFLFFMVLEVGFSVLLYYFPPYAYITIACASNRLDMPRGAFCRHCPIPNAWLFVSPRNTIFPMVKKIIRDI